MNIIIILLFWTHSAGIVNYLLEKVRVVHRAQGERSFHIFYQLCAGAGDMPGLKAELGLQSAAHYDYLNSSGRESLQIEVRKKSFPIITELLFISNYDDWIICLL